MKNLNDFRLFMFSNKQPTWYELTSYLEEHNFNVPAGLAIAFKWHSEKYNLPINGVIKSNFYNEKYAKYADEVKKYLLLI